MGGVVTGGGVMGGGVMERVVMGILGSEYSGSNTVMVSVRVKIRILGLGL